LFSGPINPGALNLSRPLILVYDPVAGQYSLATFLDDVQLAQAPFLAIGPAGDLYVAVETTEQGRSLDGSVAKGQGDILLLGFAPPPPGFVSNSGIPVQAVDANNNLQQVTITFVDSVTTPGFVQANPISASQISGFRVVGLPTTSRRQCNYRQHTSLLPWNIFARRPDLP